MPSDERERPSEPSETAERKTNRLKRKSRRNACNAYSDNLPYAFCEQIGKEIRDISDETPFEIPDSWEWCRIGSVFTLQAGKNISANQIAENVEEGLYPCFGGNGVRGYVPLFNREGYYPIIGRQGALCGNINLANGQFYATEHAVCVETFANTNVLWCCYFFTALNLNQYATATAQPGLAVANINEVLIPLPPLSEQHRIVAKIEELLPYIERYGKAEEHLTALNTTFPEALKKSILQEAVQGKLVPQNTDDEPASVLLERIRAEKQELIKQGKIKKNKNESVIITRDKIPYEIIDGTERCIADEVPFEIPDSWCWCRLGTIFQHNTGKALNSSNHQGTMKQYITTSNLYWDRFELDKLRKMLFTDSEVEKCTVTKGDLLVCEGGDIGRAAIWNYDYPMRIQNHIHRLRSYAPVEVYFFYYVFYLYKRAGLIGGKGIGIQGLSSNAIDKLLIPLPPLAEQKKIVAKIEELMQYCDKL